MKSDTALQNRGQWDSILIVESNEICRFLAALLQQFGYRNVVASPEDGATVFRERRNEIAAVVTNMPREYLDRGAPVVYLAALPERDVAARCAAVLRKPFQHWELLNVLDRLGLAGLRQTSSHGHWIIAIDDDPAFLAVLTTLLRGNKYHVIQARDGEEALKLLERFHSIIDLAIVDLVLPKRDGFEVIGILTRRENPIRILAASAVYSDTELEAAKALGAHAAIHKPREVHGLSEREWLETVENLLAAN